MEHEPLEDVYLLLNIMDIPASYVNLPEGTTNFSGDVLGEVLGNVFFLVSSVKKSYMGYIGVSKNRGNPNWMVYNGKPF